MLSTGFCAIACVVWVTAYISAIGCITLLSDTCSLLLYVEYCITICYTFGMADLIFEWDEGKNKLNQKLHGIAFEDAKFVFNDPFKIIMPDLYHSEKIVSRVLFVVFTERSENIIRIISARTATKAERKLYNDQNNQIKSKR